MSNPEIRSRIRWQLPELTLALACTVLALALPASALAGDSPQLRKVAMTVTDPVGIDKDATTNFSFQILFDCYDNLGEIVDVVPAEFDVIALTPSCGEATWTEDRNGKGKDRKFAPDEITWDLDGDTATTDPCICDGSQEVLLVEVATEQNHGRRRGRPQTLFEPTSCGPLSLNDGAVLYDGDGYELATSNSLQVATCLDQAVVEECVDVDDDGWSISCGDCDDEDSAVYPGAVPVCDDGNEPAAEALEDDDCDGVADWPNLGGSCDTGVPGICADGVELCMEDGTGSECVQTEFGSAEICDDLLDNDCDGLVDGADPDCAT